MKKISFLFIAGLLMVISLPAQEGIHIGFGGMPQNTWILSRDDRSIGQDSFSYVMTWGYAGMFKLGYNFGPPFGIHVGVFYSKQGQKHEFTADSTAERRMAQRDLRYVKIPLLFHFSGDPDNTVNFSFDMGPQLDILLDANYLHQDTLVDPGFDYSQAFKLQNLSFAWSLGMDFKVSDFMWINLTHRGDYSILDMESKEFLIPTSNQPFYPDGRRKANNLDLGIMLGVTFCVLPDLGGQGQWWIR